MAQQSEFAARELDNVKGGAFASICARLTTLARLVGSPGRCFCSRQPLRRAGAASAWSHAADERAWRGAAPTAASPRGSGRGASRRSPATAAAAAASRLRRCAGGGVSAALAPPSTRTAGTAAGADTAAAAPSAAPAGCLCTSTCTRRRARQLPAACDAPSSSGTSKPKFGAGGAMKMDADQLLEAKEAELDKWLRKFVKKNGLQELYDSKPDAQYESVLLKEDIGLNAAEVQGVVRQERESYRVRARHASSMRRGMAGIEDKAMHVSTYAGRSGTTRANREAQLEKHCEAVGSSFAAALASEYAAAKLEGQREFQVSEINSQREALRSRFGEDVEVDLAKALLDPQAGGFSGGAFGDTLAGGDSEAAGLATRKAIETMEGVSERFAAEVGMSPLRRSARRCAAEAAAGGSGGGSRAASASAAEAPAAWAAAAGERTAADAKPPALDEDSEDDGSALSPLRPQRKSTPRSPAISAQALPRASPTSPAPPRAPPPSRTLAAPRSRALDPGGGVPFGVPMAPRSPHTPLSPPPAGMLQQQQQVSAGLGPPSTPPRQSVRSPRVRTGLTLPVRLRRRRRRCRRRRLRRRRLHRRGICAFCGRLRVRPRRPHRWRAHARWRAAAAAAAAAGLKLQPAGQYDRLVLEQSDDSGRIQQEQGGGGGGFQRRSRSRRMPRRLCAQRRHIDARSDGLRLRQQRRWRRGGAVAATQVPSASNSPEKGKAANSSSPRPFPPPPTLEPVTVFASNSPFLQRRPGG